MIKLFRNRSQCYGMLLTSLVFLLFFRSLLNPALYLILFIVTCVSLLFLLSLFITFKIHQPYIMKSTAQVKGYEERVALRLNRVSRQNIYESNIW
jgi:hypothetical protein